MLPSKTDIIIESSCKLNPAFREHLNQRGNLFYRMKRRDKIYIWLSAGIILLFLIFYAKKRTNYILENGTKGRCKVLDIKTLAKGTTTWQTVAIIEIYYNNNNYLTEAPIYPKTEIGKCYNVLFNPLRPTEAIVDFSNSISCLE